MEKQYHTGYISGVFDVFHLGNLKLIEKCKAACEKLIIGVFDDEYAKTISDEEIIYPEDMRLKLIKGLEAVDDAFLVKGTEEPVGYEIDKYFDLDLMGRGGTTEPLLRNKMTSKPRPQKTVITVGVFDFFHYGHLILFENAKKYGDYLVVAVQDGDFILKTKPNADIFYTTQERINMVSAFKVVDEVVVYRDVDTSLPKEDFDIFAIGGDQTHDGFKRAVKWCNENGREVVGLSRTPRICSSDIKRRLSNYLN